MLEKKLDILSEDVLQQADAICFTSNGVVRKNGRLVMGAGVAKAFRDRFSGLDEQAGNCVKFHGNICQIVSHEYVTPIVVFPTKHHWRDPSDPNLICKSAKELKELADKYKWNSVFLPRPGVGMGGLDWKRVQSMIEPILSDDRFIIVYK